VSFGETLLLGAIAGSTIFLGLPVGRLAVLGPRGRVALAMFAVGVLAFLFVDVLEHALAIVEKPVEEKEGFGKVLGLNLLLGGGFGLSLLGLGAMERRRTPLPPPPAAGGSADAVAPADLLTVARHEDAVRSATLRTGMTIAAAIGVHNFAEGLAIGVSAASGEIGLATVLIAGFALHNTTEGFGIVGPLGNVRPSWRWLGLAGLVGGGPTFLGTIVGYQVTSEPLELAFYAVAGGAILYVLLEVWSAMRRAGHRELGLVLLAVGFIAGVATDLIVVAGGG
jgi:ZIP family zinc transporter